jgi:glyoxylase-like metal-dependent hydrolase (beta-lactamase superfamily II)
MVLALAGCATADQRSLGWHVVPGTFAPGRGPDGNSVFLDAPEGLILVDTGRHPAHRDRLLAYARERGRPIAAVINTHWHLDHSTGNREIRGAYPQAPLYATGAVEGALTGFFPQSRRSAEQHLASGNATPEQRAEIERGFAVMDEPDSLRATRPVTRSETMTIAGRRLRVNLAPFAATEADIWLHDPAAELVIAGDLVVGIVPFFDTGCPEGWRRALDQLAATPFRTLVPGHGDVMDRARFLAWRGAFNSLLDCAASSSTAEQCADGWVRDAAAFIPAGDGRRARAMALYYLNTRLKAAPAERDRFCDPLR